MTSDESLEESGGRQEDPLAEAILALLRERGVGRSISPTDAARAYADARARPGDPPELWRRYLQAVKQQALHLARQKRLVILRKGKPADPHAPIKGVIRLALPETAREPLDVRSGQGDSPKPPVICGAGSEQIDAVAAMIRGAPDSFFEAGFTEAGRAVFEDFVSQAAIAARLAEKATGYVAREGSEVVGYIETRSTDHVTLLFVRGDRQGRGIARLLLHRALKDLVGTTVTVHASPSAVPVYERLGFKASGTVVTEKGIHFLPMALHRQGQGNRDLPTSSA